MCKSMLPSQPNNLHLYRHARSVFLTLSLQIFFFFCRPYNGCLICRICFACCKVDSSTGSADSNSRLKSGKIRVDTLNTASCNPESEASAASTVCSTSSLTSLMDNAALLIIVINSSRYCRVDPFRDNIQDELTFFYYLEYQNQLLVMLGYARSSIYY
jgi:hypothetical protein